MENETIIRVADEDFQVRGLLRREVRKLKEKGLSISGMDMEKAEETMDAVLQMVLSPEQADRLEDLPYAESVRVWNEVVKLTYGSPGEEKN